MEKEILTYDKIKAMDLPNIIMYAAPVMIGLVLLEWGISFYQNRKYYDGKDTLAATVVGLVNVGLGAALKIFTFGLAIICYNLVPWSVPATWWSYVICLIWIDFWRYWAHRIGHESRFWWATHVTHHSSQQYNLSVAFRLGWTQYIKVIFFIPVMLVGFNPAVFFICHQIEVLYQFWIHTEYIKKLPKPIEYIFTTPSHHRVHHATNPKYIDRNYGSTFIIWDRLFGTFQPEEEHPDYGITTEVKKPYNPIYLVFHEWAAIFKDMSQAKNFKEAMLIMFGYPGKYQPTGKRKQSDKALASNKKTTSSSGAL